MIEVFEELEQGSDEWRKLRAGMPTASEFHDVIAKRGPRGGVPKGRQKLLWRLAGEVITGEPEETYQNADMMRGHEEEPEARDYYAYLKDVEPVRVAFIKNGNCGCSPDSLIGSDGLLELKSAKPSVQIERLIDGTLPPEHKAQCQGQLMVSGRQWLDFMSYSPRLPPLIVRVERDERYIAALRVDVDGFVDELNQLVEWIRRM